MARSRSTHRPQLSVGGSGAAAVALLGATLIFLPACYSRVTRASGFGADQYSVSEPYQRNGKVDDWIFGKQQPAKQSGTRIPPTPPRN